MVARQERSITWTLPSCWQMESIMAWTCGSPWVCSWSAVCRAFTGHCLVDLLGWMLSLHAFIARQYLFYLSQIGLAMSPCSNNQLLLGRFGSTAEHGRAVEVLSNASSIRRPFVWVHWVHWVLCPHLSQTFGISTILISSCGIRIIGISPGSWPMRRAHFRCIFNVVSMCRCPLMTPWCFIRPRSY